MREIHYGDDVYKALAAVKLCAEDALWAYGTIEHLRRNGCGEEKMKRSFEEYKSLVEELYEAIEHMKKIDVLDIPD